ncbi:hypothetical protein [Aminipila terrae]|uniref:DUF4878 domain-containing protein n=1 Tax=Aminipila terrae TaxID=2697030 RepID=A0A6P1MII0_9FIRM|nr:hypothetical protein [Aminipila terrae]QHI71798.1 hypothetical protein Ami3637_04805 [Aminipila terrae]
MDNQTNADNCDEKEIENVLKDFFRAYYNSERIEMFNYLDAEFQKYVPITRFLILPDFYRDLGVLAEICKVRIKAERQIALVDCVINLKNQEKGMVIAMKKEFGIWKINGKRMFR